MRFGISNLAIVPMRIQPMDKSEMINQMLFGEHFTVIDEDKGWSKIRLAHDDYEGWVCNKQWIEIDNESYNQLDNEIPVITTDILDIVTRKNHQPIVIGSILPSYRSGYALINKEMYRFDGNTTPGFTKKEKLIENALVYLNSPYLWGGRSPFGIDCSGFTQMVYRLQGFKIPRDAYQQAKIGKNIDSLIASKMGDLAFFENNEGKIIHVGLILKDNNIIHASGKVRIDKIDKKGIYNNEINTHTHKLRFIKRIL